MHEAIRTMMAKYNRQSRDDTLNALREILQDITLLGLWRSKFFERAAFYGGTALRILYGLDRFSEDLDFSLLKPDAAFTLGAYGTALKREISSFGFHVDFAHTGKAGKSPMESAFLKANTLKKMIVVQPPTGLLTGRHPNKQLKINWKWTRIRHRDLVLRADTPFSQFLLPSRHTACPTCLPVKYTQFCAGGGSTV